MTWYETSYVSIGPRSLLDKKTVRIMFSDICGLGQPVPKRNDWESGFISYWFLNPTQIASILDQIDTAITLIRQTSQINYGSYLLWLTASSLTPSHIFCNGFWDKISAASLGLWWFWKQKWLFVPFFLLHSETWVCCFHGCTSALHLSDLILVWADNTPIFLTH